MDSTIQIFLAGNTSLSCVNLKISLNIVGNIWDTASTQFNNIYKKGLGVFIILNAELIHIMSLSQKDIKVLKTTITTTVSIIS